jgi:hypothetical protein
LHPDYDGMPPKLEIYTKKTFSRPGVPIPRRFALLYRQQDPCTSLASDEVHSSEELARPSGTRREGSRGISPRIPRTTIPRLLTRPSGEVATLAVSPSVSASTNQPPFDMMDEALVVAAEYEQCEDNSSVMSGPSSDVSFPSRGWVSVAAYVQGDPASAVMARARGCHVCFRIDQFLIDWPLVPPEVRQAITTQRTQQIQQDRGVLPGWVNPPTTCPSAPHFTSGVAPRSAPQFPRSAYIPTPTWGPTPHYTNSGRSSYPATVTVNPVQPMYPVPEEPTSMVTPAAENFVGDV